jgi:hypothetical protein
MVMIIFNFYSDVLGEMKLPLERIRSIACQPKTNSVQLTTVNGDTLTAQFVTKVVAWKPRSGRQTAGEFNPAPDGFAGGKTGPNAGRLGGVVVRGGECLQPGVDGSGNSSRL